MTLSHGAMTSGCETIASIPPTPLDASVLFLGRAQYSARLKLYPLSSPWHRSQTRPGSRP